MSNQLMEMTMQPNITPPALGAMTPCTMCSTPFAKMRRAQHCCGDTCKKAFHRLPLSQKRDKLGLSFTHSAAKYLTGKKSGKSASQSIEGIELFRPTSANSENASLVFERVNAVTMKVTDGSKVRTTASHGQWAGSDGNRALAWLMDIGWVSGVPAWMVRIGPVSFGPTTLHRAKAVAVSLLTGSFIEPVQRIVDPIGRMMIEQASLVETHSAIAKFHAMTDEKSALLDEVLS